MSRIAGMMTIKANGTQYNAKGNFTYRINPTKRETISGPDQVHGFKELPQPNFIEGMITDSSNLDLKGFQQIEDATVTIELANGKTIVLYEAWYASDGDVTTEEAEIQCRFESKRGEEIPV